MALTTCTECGNQVSTEAKACPSCGRATPAGAGSSLRRWLAVAAVVLVLLVGFAVWQAEKAEDCRADSNATKLLEDEAEDCSFPVF